MPVAVRRKPSDGRFLSPLPLTDERYAELVQAKMPQAGRVRRRARRSLDAIRDAMPRRVRAAQSVAGGGDTGGAGAARWAAGVFIKGSGVPARVVLTAPGVGGWAAGGPQDPSLT